METDDGKSIRGLGGIHFPRRTVSQLCPKTKRRHHVGDSTGPDESANALSKKYHEALNVDLVAAVDARLGALGFGQLLSPGVAFKRDAWKRIFAEVIGDLGFSPAKDHWRFASRISAADEDILQAEHKRQGLT